MEATAFCQLAAGFADEPDVAVWRTLVAGLGWCDRLLDGEPRERFRSFVRALVGPRLQALGWTAAEGEDDLTGELRGLLIRALAVLGDDAGAQATASELFEQRLRDPAAVDPGHRGRGERRRGDRRGEPSTDAYPALQGGDDTPGAAPVPVRWPTSRTRN